MKSRDIGCIIRLSDTQVTKAATAVSWILGLLIALSALSEIGVVITSIAIYRADIHLAITAIACVKLIAGYYCLVSAAVAVFMLGVVYDMLFMRPISWWWGHITIIMLLLGISVCGAYVCISVYNLLSIDAALHGYAVAGDMQNDTTRLLAEQYIRTRF